MKRSQIQTLPLFFDRYILLVEDIDLINALEIQKDNFSKLHNKFSEIFSFRYSEKKWSTAEVLQHIIDNEVIQLNRALRISRGDNTPLPGYDEQKLINGFDSKFDDPQILFDQFHSLRSFTISVFKNCNQTMLLRTGLCSEIEISTLALGFQIVGHQIHHIEFLKKNYFK